MNVNTLGKNFGRSLLKTGIEVLGKSVSPTYEVIKSTPVRLFIERYFPTSKVIFFDTEYRITTPDFWNEMDAEIYEITKKQWTAQVYDCDDKAYTHK